MGCYDSDSPGHAPRYLDVRHFFDKYNMTNNLHGRLAYSGLRASVKNGVVLLGLESDWIVKMSHNVNGFVVETRELGSLGDAQIGKIQVMFTINTLSIDLNEGHAFSRLWLDKIEGFNVVMNFVESHRGNRKVRILP